MKLTSSFAFILALTSTVLADIEFTIPTAGTIFKAGNVVTAIWKESGKHPKISELVQYDLYLCAGGDPRNSYEELSTLMKDVPFARGNSVSFPIDPTLGGNDKNAYFLKLVASGPTTSVTNYSERFTISGMTGSFPPYVANWTADSRHESPSVNTDQQEDNDEYGYYENHLWKRKATLDPYAVPYPMQTGPTRYAPMAKRPGSTIATTSPTPQFSATPYIIATTFLPPATVETTLTASQTYSVFKTENTAAPAPHPDEVQAK